MVVTKSTWENLDQFTSQYPTFDLEDKVNFNGSGIVINGPKKGANMEAQVAEDPNQKEANNDELAPNRKRSHQMQLCIQALGS